MPRLVKGGKYVYGWSEVDSNGRIVVPGEALEEYGFKDACKVIVMPASKRSGGFALTTPSLLKNSRLSVILDGEPRLAEFRLREGETVTVGTRTYCWVKLNSKGEFVVPEETLKAYRVNLGDRLLVGRGSGLALAFIAKGPIVAEARKHSGLAVFR
jgi:bifunctional DNA-binding transcriptional regulator/antitoxin component of YhaV-PrlF toxin-antitoxin module